MVRVELFGKPEGLLVGDLCGARERGGVEGGGVAYGEDVVHGGAGLLACWWFGGFGVGGRLRLVLGLELHAEMVVDADEAGAGVTLDDPLFLGWYGRFGGVVIIVEDGRRVRWEASHTIKRFSDEWVGHVAGAPDAHADADIALLYGGDGVDSVFGFGGLVVAGDGVIGEAFAEGEDLVGGFDGDVVALCLLHGVVGECSIEHREDARRDVVERYGHEGDEVRIDVAQVLSDEVG